MQIQPETIIWNQPSATSKPVAKTPARASDVFRLEKSSEDRTAGSMPVWGQPKTPEEKIASALQSATRPNTPPSLASALADTSQPAAAAAAGDDSFGFSDVLDMINPLQHIPIVSTIYRDLTGDTIKPVSRLVGGAAFGGVIGAAAGAVNALFQMETGKDVADNMISSLNDPAPATTNTGDTTIALVNLRGPQRTYNS